MGLAGADGPREDQILGRGDPVAAGQRVELRGVDALGGGEVKGVERLDLREAGLAQPLPHHGLVPRRQLRREDLMQVVFVGPVGIACLSGHVLKHARHAGKLQGPRLQDHQVAGERADAHTATSRSQPS